MAFKLKSRVRETSTAPGSGAFGLNGALDSTYFAFSAKYADQDTFFYAAKGAAGSEEGLGRFNSSGNTVTRVQIYSSTNSGSAVNFSAGSVDVFVSNVAPDDLDAAGLMLWMQSGGAQGTHGADIASAATLNLETATGNFVHVTGTTAITAITLSDGHQRTVYFTGALTLTNGASLVLPGAANIVTAAGDIAVFVADGTTVRCSDYVPAALRLITPGTDFVKPNTASAFSAAQSFTLATLTDGASIAWDVNAGQKAKVTLGGNRTMAAVTNAVEGTTYYLWAVQDGSGSRTLAYTTTGAGSFDFGTAGAPTLTTTASKADLLCFEAISIGGTLKLRYMGIAKGFS